MSRSVNRRSFVIGLGALAGVTAIAACSSGSQQSSAGSPAPSGPLVFDKDTYAEKTVTITTDSGDKVVVYRFYGPLTYVAKPVDTDHQSLVISVPVTIDGKPVDVTNAPVLFANAVGGYMPASVKDATGVGGAAMEMGPLAPPSGAAPGGAPSGSNAMQGGGGKQVSLPKLALAAGYVVVEPGCRGRTLTDAKGVYYGTAPAAIVDLKSAVRYLRFNKGRVPGNVDRIVSTGISAGGALSALLGASGDSPEYAKYFTELGAADASDAIFASGSWCPITDLEHADGAYEWNWGANVNDGTGKVVDQSLSKALRDQFAQYQDSLKLLGRNNFGPLTAENYADYLLRSYLQPSATRYLAGLPDADRTTYLAANPGITWSNGAASFTWDGFLAHVGPRRKSAPAFDSFDLSAPENNEFGTGMTESRHFTQFSLDRNTTGLTNRTLDADIPGLLNLMNPMYFIGRRNENRAKHWWIRLGTKDTDTALIVSANLAAGLDNLGDDVSHLMYWDEGHGSNTDAADFISWVAKIAA
ncbi:subtype B tannase [Mycolicibacterium sp. Y3]